MPNNKLKQARKIDIQKKLLFNNKKPKNPFKEEKETINEFEMMNKSRKGINSIVKTVDSKGVISIVVGIAFMFMLLFASSSMVVPVSALASTPDITVEEKQGLLTTMEELDKSCGKKLSSGYKVIGDKTETWKAVFSLYFGYYENDVTQTTNGTYVDMVEEASRRYGVNKWLIYAVIDTESSWIFHEPNQYTACGFMQVTRACATDMGFDYEQVRTDEFTNVMCGTAYLRSMLDMFGDEVLATAAYNAGPNKVKRYGCTVPPYKETQDYVVRVSTRKEKYKNGELTPPDGSCSVETELNRIYGVINEVVDSKTLKRRDFYEALEVLNYTQEQKDIAIALYELDSWEEFFGEDFDCNFNIVGSLSGNFEGVQFIDGTRPSGQLVVDYALTQVGQIGGQPYWSYYGFSSRVAWCACFVNWVFRTEPTGAGASYPTTAMTSNNAYCPTLVNWFKANGRWGERNYDNLITGDVIFFDWESNGEVDHIGIVCGRDETYVYTVEGNSGNAVRTKKYALNSKSIAGYGLNNF